MSFKVESKIGKSACMDEDLFDFLSDFTKFTKLLPPQHQANISATQNECRINAGIMGSIVLTYEELERPKLIKITPAAGNEKIRIWIQLKQVGPYDTRVKVTISIEAGFMAKMMVKSQIEQFADRLVDGICQIQPYLLSQANQSYRYN